MSSATSNCCDFVGDYELSKLPEIKKLEQSALGCDYGGTSWTTRQQVDAIVETLQLSKESMLLDVGSGSGWPGLLLSKLSDCNVTLLDIPRNALRHARQRAVDDEMQAQVYIASGNGLALPFIDGCFDRVSHSDVLCCLPEKLEFLTEVHRVACSGARMHFSVILHTISLHTYYARKDSHARF